MAVSFTFINTLTCIYSRNIIICMQLYGYHNNVCLLCYISLPVCCCCCIRVRNLTVSCLSQPAFGYAYVMIVNITVRQWSSLLQVMGQSHLHMTGHKSRSGLYNQVLLSQHILKTLIGSLAPNHDESGLCSHSERGLESFWDWSLPIKVQPAASPTSWFTESQDNNSPIQGCQVSLILETKNPSPLLRYLLFLEVSCSIEHLGRVKMSWYFGTCSAAMTVQHPRPCLFVLHVWTWQPMPMVLFIYVIDFPV